LSSEIDFFCLTNVDDVAVFLNRWKNAGFRSLSMGFEGGVTLKDEIKWSEEAKCE
jgi:hypothetical protein